MNAIVLSITIGAVAVVVVLLLWVFLCPATRKTRPAAASQKAAPVQAIPANASREPKPAPPKDADGPSVEVPENTSPTRWVGKMIDEHPDEAAAVLRRWIQEK